MKPSRKITMIETRKLIQKEYRVFKALLPMDNNLESRVYPLLSRRINDLGIRSLFARLVFQYITEIAEQERVKIDKSNAHFYEQQLPFIAEVIISIQYYHNRILDGKGGLRDASGQMIKEKVDQHLIAGNLIKDTLWEYIDQKVFPTDSKKNKLVTQTVRRIFQLVDLGQDMQDNYGTVDKYLGVSVNYPVYSSVENTVIDHTSISFFWKSLNSNGIHSKNEWFVRSYLKRIQLTSGALFQQIATLITELTGYKGPQRENIIKFGMFNGMLGQLVNDNNDYVLPEYNISTSSKIPEDAFADLRNDNMTLPLVYFLQNQNDPKAAILNLQETLNRRSAYQQVPADHWYDFNHFSVKEIFYNKEYLQRTALQALLPATRRSISTVLLIKQEIDKLQLLDTTIPAGEYLYDMNSIVHVENNRFYQKIMAEAPPEEVIVKYKQESIMPQQLTNIINSLLLQPVSRLTRQFAFV